MDHPREFMEYGRSFGVVSDRQVKMWGPSAAVSDLQVPSCQVPSLSGTCCVNRDSAVMFATCL